MSATSIAPKRRPATIPNTGRFISSARQRAYGVRLRPVNHRHRRVQPDRSPPLGHDRSLREVERLARRFFEGAPGGPWRTATVDLVEAPLLHDRGRPEEALRLVRQAARQFDLARDHDRLIERGPGRGDQLLVARIAAKMGLFELRYGSIAEASRLLAEALKHFDRAGCAEDALRTRGHLAEAAAADLVGLHILAGREQELPSLTATFVELFRTSGLPVNAMEPLAYLRARARAGCLTQADVLVSRSFFEDLPRKPSARFRAP